MRVMAMTLKIPHRHPTNRFRCGGRPAEATIAMTLKHLLPHHSFLVGARKTAERVGARPADLIRLTDGRRRA